MADDKKPENLGQKPADAGQTQGQVHGQSAAHAHGKHDQTSLRQTQANHFKAVMDHASQILNDPNSSQEAKDEAQATLNDMSANLDRLQVKYGVVPQ